MRAISLDHLDIERLRELLKHADFPKKAISEHPLIQKYLNDYQLLELIERVQQHGAGSFKSGDFCVAAHYWIPANPLGTTFIVHGYIDHSGLYGHLIKHLLAQGQAVVCFDLPGHGLSSGDKLSIDCFSQYEQVLSDCLNGCADFPKPFNAVGQSTGGAILLKTLLKRHQANQANPFQQVILLAPLIRPCRWLYSLVLRTVAKFIINDVPRKYQVNSHDLRFLKFLKSGDPLQAHTIPLDWIGAMHQWVRDFDKAGHCPWSISVVQGDSDTTVDWRYNIAAIQCKFSNASITTITDARHHLVNESVGYRSQVFAQINFTTEH
jgi:alpha-beta hydrolase superfamily lysophospholipase